MYISGISTLIQYNFEDRKILLLGEAHTNEKTCDLTKKDTIDVAQYVTNVTDEIPDNMCLDIFLEGSYKQRFSRFPDSGMIRTSETLETKNFLSRVLEIIRLKKGKNLRIHYIDPRMILDDRSWISHSWIRVVSPYVYKLKDVMEKFRDLISENDLLDALDHLLTFKKKQNRKAFLKVFQTFKELGKGSFQKIGFLQSETLENIDFWEETYFKIIEKELGKLDDSTISRKQLVRHLRNTYHYLIQYPQERYANIFLYDEYEWALNCLMLAPMDMYTLARMFIKFDDKPGTICNDNPLIINLIVHSGSGHTEVYEHFLNAAFGIQPTVKHENPHFDQLCLDIGDFDYWFD